MNRASRILRQRPPGPIGGGRTHFHSASVSAALVLTALSTGGANVEAQDSAATATGGLEEITVTARRREESLQEVPLAISAFNSDDLESAGVRTLKDLSYLTPGITINSNGAEGQLQPVIRGLVNLNAGAGDPNVAVFLDGIYLQNISAISLSLLDIERVEIVKGPVSALYGRNAFAGAINYVSKQPPKELLIKGGLGAGNDGQQTVSLSLAGPIGERFQARIAAVYDSFDGSYADAVNGVGMGGYEKKDMQVMLGWQPTDKLSLSLGWYYGDDFFDDIARSVNTNNCGLPGPVFAGVQITAFNQYCGEIRSDVAPEAAPVAEGAGVSGNQRRVHSVSLNGDYTFGWGSLSVLNGYNLVTQQGYIDFAARRAGIPFLLTPGPGLVSLFGGFGADFNNEDSSHEVRLASNQEQRLRWAVGGYYFKSRSSQTTLVGLDVSRVPAGQRVNPAFHGSALLFATSDGRFSSSNLSQADSTERTKSVFVGLDWDVIDTVTLSGEFRDSQQDKTVDVLRNTFVTNVVRPFGFIPPGKFDFNNYRLTAKWQFRPNMMLYASAADGTKGGGFNQRATIPSEFTFDPESNETYEMGFKASFLENRLQLNAAIYDIKTKNLQIQGVSDNPNQVGLVTKNFGGTDVQGFEIDLAASPAEGLKVTAGIGYVDAKFAEGTYIFSGNTNLTAPSANILTCLAIPSCAPSVVTVATLQGNRRAINLAGNDVPRTSELQGNLGIEYTATLNETWDWTGRFDYRHEAKQTNSIENYNYWGDKNVINVRFGLIRDKLRITFYGDNLTNDMTPETSTPNTRLNDFVPDWQAYLPARATYGVMVDYEF